MKAILPLLAVASLALGACSVHVRPAQTHVHKPNHSHAHGKVVVVKKGHKHSARCGHYRHDGRWYYVKGHVHGPRCGHHLHRGVWVIKR